MKAPPSRTAPPALALLGLFAVALATAGPAQAQADLFLVADVPTALGPGTFRPSDVVRRGPAGYASELALPPGVRINALHRLTNQDWLFAVGSTTDLGGTLFRPRDVVRFDGANYTRFLDGAAAGLPPEARIDALLLAGGDAGDPVLSFDAPTVLATRTFAPADLVRVTGGAFGVYFDSALVNPPIPRTSNVTGAAAEADSLLMTFDVPTTLGTQTYLPGEVVAWDGAGFTSRSLDPGWPLSSRIHGLWVPDGLICDDPDGQDGDGDGVDDPCDNCPGHPNPGQGDHDGDTAGDACDDDDDDDGVLDDVDCAPMLAGLSQVASPVGDTLFLDGGASPALFWQPGVQGPASNVYRGAIDPRTLWTYAVECVSAERVIPALAIPGDPAPGKTFFYLVSAVNACGESPMTRDSAGGDHYPRAACGPRGADFDNDGVPDLEDNCPVDGNAGQADTDRDFVGDTCDNCPNVANPDQSDADADGLGDLCDG